MEGVPVFLKSSWTGPCLPARSTSAPPVASCVPGRALRGSEQGGLHPPGLRCPVSQGSSELGVQGCPWCPRAVPAAVSHPVCPLQSLAASRACAGRGTGAASGLCLMSGAAAVPALAAHMPWPLLRTFDVHLYTKSAPCPCTALFSPVWALVIPDWRTVSTKPFTCLWLWVWPGAGAEHPWASILVLCYPACVMSCFLSTEGNVSSVLSLSKPLLILELGLSC